ncbi:MAG TPA: hypothetical protein VIJ00_18495, partial [Nakamurella sp.]
HRGSPRRAPPSRIGWLTPPAGRRRLGLGVTGMKDWSWAMVTAVGSAQAAAAAMAWRSVPDGRGRVGWLPAVRVHAAKQAAPVGRVPRQGCVGRGEWQVGDPAAAAPQ